jgi:hypothetical protein
MPDTIVIGAGIVGLRGPPGNNRSNFTSSYPGLTHDCPVEMSALCGLAARLLTLRSPWNVSDRKWQSPFSRRHSRAGGNPGLPQRLSQRRESLTAQLAISWSLWIPACAGMTEKLNRTAVGLTRVSTSGRLEQVFEIYDFVPTAWMAGSVPAG